MLLFRDNSKFGGTASEFIQSGTINRVDLAIYHTAMKKEKGYGSILPYYTTTYAQATISTPTYEFTVTSDVWSTTQ